MAIVYCAESLIKKFELIGHKKDLRCAEFSPDDKKIVTTSVDTTARIWCAESGS